MIALVTVVIITCALAWRGRARRHAAFARLVQLGTLQGPHR